MDTNEGRHNASLVHGNLMRLEGKRRIAIYLLDHVVWVADFDGDRARVFTASEWFSLNQGGRVLRRVALDSITPLPNDIAERLEQWHHRMTEARDRPLTSRMVAELFAQFRVRLARFFDSPFRRSSSRPVGPATH